MPLYLMYVRSDEWPERVAQEITMQRQSDGSLALDLADLIRMNQMIRGQTNLTGFVDWYDTLSSEEQISLLCHLHLFAQQAGGDEQVFRAAAQASQLPSDSELVRLLASFRGLGSRELRVTLEEWLMRHHVNERRLLLPLLVHYFGLAEGAVYANETVDSCNHWWHRDLHDPRVVQDILSNPAFFRTAMKDDLMIKKR